MKKFLKKIIVWIITIEAKIVLHKYKPMIVAVTGSVGKTSTKDAIYTTFSPVFYVRKNEKSFNSEIGVPLTVLGCPNGWNNILVWIENILKGAWMILFRVEYPKWLVLEIGADRPKDIKKICKWIKPDVAVVTRLSDTPVHVEYFTSPEHVKREKRYLVEALKEKGSLILNSDDRDVLSFAKYAKPMNKVYTYGFDTTAHINASHYQISYDENGKPKGIQFRVNIGGSSIPVNLDGVLGSHHVYPILAALASTESQNIKALSIKDSLENHISPRGRMKILEGVNDSIIIDDTYNSSPVALDEALNTLNEIETAGRKIALLGDMMELGEYTIAEHKKMGEKVAKIAKILVTVGVRSRDIAEAAENKKLKKVKHFNTAEEAGQFLAEIIKPNDVILAKASQSVRMEKAVMKILKNPQLAKNLLVRQEVEWKER